MIPGATQQRSTIVGWPQVARAGVAAISLGGVAVLGILAVHGPAQARPERAYERLVGGTTVAASTPVPGEDWQWMLSSVPSAANLAADPDVRAWDIDGFDADASDVSSIHALPALAICYISAGSWEDWRSDAADFPTSVLGANNGWPGEKWLDVRRVDVLEPIMASRMQMCKDKGFDGVEADNVDGYTNQSGFPLSAAHQLKYNRMLADTAHALGLSIGLKNDVEQVTALEPDFDFAVNEQCYQYNECDAYQAFFDAGKAVWIVEYRRSTTTFCPAAIEAGYDAMKKRMNLGPFRVAC